MKEDCEEGEGSGISRSLAKRDIVEVTRYREERRAIPRLNSADNNNHSCRRRNSSSWLKPIKRYFYITESLITVVTTDFRSRYRRDERRLKQAHSRN